MNRFPCIAAAAVLALNTATSAYAGLPEQVWTGKFQRWSMPGSPDCKLNVDRVSQPRTGMPFRVAVDNVGPGMLRYSFSIRVSRAGKEEFRSGISVDKAKAGDLKVRDTSAAYSGSLEGAAIGVQLTSCSVIG